MIPTKLNSTLRITCVLTLLFVFSGTTNLFSQSQVQSSGDWNNPAIWVGGTIPTLADDVEIIGDYDVTVSTDAVCNNLVMQANYSHNATAQLNISNAAQLIVNGNLEMNDQARNNNSVFVLVNEASELLINGNVSLLKDGSSSTNNDMYIQLDDDNSLLTVIGDLNLNFSLSNNSSNDFGLVLNQNSKLITENLNFTMAGGYMQNSKIIQVNQLGQETDSATLQINNNFNVDISGGLDMQIHINSKGLMNIGNNLNVNTTGGRNIKVILNHDAQIHVTNDFILTENSNGNFYLINNNLNQSGGTYEDDSNAKFFVGGDFIVNKTDGDEFRIQLIESSIFEISGNFDLNVSNSDSSNNSLMLTLKDNSQLKVDGSFNINFHEESQNPDLLIDIEDNAIFQTGEDFIIILNKADITDIDIIDNGQLIVGRDFKFSNNVGGSTFQLDLDNTASMQVTEDMFIYSESHGACKLHLDGDAILTVGDTLLIDKKSNNYTEIYLNNYTDGSANDAQLNVQGDFIINKAIGSPDHIKLYIKQSADLNVDGNFVVNMNNTVHNPDFEFNLYNDAGLNVGSSFIFNSSAGDFWLKMYETSNIVIGDAWSMDFTDASRFQIYYYGNAEIAVAGDFDFTKNSGSGRFGIDLDYNNKLTVGGDMSIVNKGINGTEIYLERDAILTVAGDLNISKENNGKIQFMLNNGADGDDTDAQVNIGGDLNLNKSGTGNDYLQLFMKRDADLNIAGNLNITSADEERSSRYSQIKLYHDSKIEVSGLMDVKMLETIKNPDFYINLYENAQLNIDSLFSINSVAGDFSVYLDDNSKMKASSWSSDLTKGENNYFRIQDDASLEIENDFTFLKEEGSGYFYLDMHDNGNLSIGEDFNVDYTGTSQFYMYLDNDVTMSTGDFSVNYDGNSYARIMLNTSSNGSENDAQLTVNGDFNFNKINGRDFHLFLYRNSGLNISGDLTVDYGNSINTSNAYIYLKHESIINALGTVDLTLKNTNQANNDFYLRLYNDTQFNIGDSLNPSETSLNLNLNRGKDFEIFLYDDGIMNVNGDMNLVKTGGEDLKFYLNQSNSGGDEPRLNIIGNLNFDNFENSDKILFQVGKGSIADVNGNIDFLNITANNRAEVVLTRSGVMSIEGAFLRNPMPNRFGKLKSSDNSTIIFDGNAPQKIASNEGDGSDSFSYKNIVLNNSYDDESPFILEGNITIPYGQNLTFIDGIVNTNNDSLFIIADEASVSGASDLSHINGPVTKLGNKAFEFPVGKNSVYRPISISAPNSNSDGFRASYLKSNPRTFGVEIDSTLANISSSEYWALDRLVGSSDVDITLSWDIETSGEITDISSLAIVGFDGEKWVDMGNDAISGDVVNGTITTNTSVVLYNPITLASRNEIDNPLPVELIEFDAEAVGNVVELNWATAAEINNDYFMVERTQDAFIFEDVTMIEGNGNSNEVIDYEALDLSPIEGVSYYRLKQTDYDGKFEYSDLQQVIFTSEENSFDDVSELSIYPNPIKRSEVLSVELYDYSKYEKVTLFISNALGNTVHSQELPTLGKRMIYYQINVNYFPGVYFVNVHTDNGVDTKRLVIN